MRPAWSGFSERAPTASSPEVLGPFTFREGGDPDQQHTGGQHAEGRRFGYRVTGYPRVRYGGELNGFRAAVCVRGGCGCTNAESGIGCKKRISLSSLSCI